MEHISWIFYTCFTKLFSASDRHFRRSKDGIFQELLILKNVSLQRLNFFSAIAPEWLFACLLRPKYSGLLIPVNMKASWKLQIWMLNVKTPILFQVVSAVTEITASDVFNN